MGCSGSMYCNFCGGVCFLEDMAADPYPYQRGLRARMEEEMEPEEPTQPAEPPPEPDPGEAA